MPAGTIRAREPSGRARTPPVDRSAGAIAARLEDAAHFPGGRANGVARPETEADVAALVTSAAPVLVIGAQSSVTGGATPAGGLVISTERLTSVRDSGRQHVRAGAGVPLETLQHLLAESGRWYAPSPTFTGAFTGGVVATNAAGAATFKYGTTRAWVDGLTVVLACGHVLDLVRGEVRAGGARGVEVVCGHGARRVVPGTYRMPDVPKCSAGYFAAPEMDLIDLFIGSEGTLGVIVDATLRVLPARPAVALALVPLASEAAALALVAELRTGSHETWRTGDPHGVDVAAVEYLDRRCLELLREDGADRRHGVAVDEAAGVVLLVQLELAAGTDAARAFDEVAAARQAGGPDTALRRFCRALDHHGAFERTELALPGDARRAAAFLALREAAPLGVNARVGEARRLVDGRIDKTAADMVVPFARLGDMLAVYREGLARRGLDHAIWGHLSDGNVHPNVIPRSWADVEAGREAILEFGREAARMGGCPLAEHGVGRSAVKQALLRDFYGEAAIDQMRAVKRALDPDWRLAPGVIFSRS